MRYAEAEAQARGCHSVWLDTFAFQARGFYERLGYRKVAHLDRYYGPGRHAWKMAKTLDGTGQPTIPPNPRE
jgi:ribosomal protein S18 acetylase RimI-like enzyme